MDGIKHNRTHPQSHSRVEPNRTQNLQILSNFFGLQENSDLPTGMSWWTKTAISLGWWIYENDLTRFATLPVYI